MALMVRPNPASGIPVYAQLIEQVRRGLETGALQPGEALPDVLPLAEALVLHPSIVARAYRELEGQQLIARNGLVFNASLAGLTIRPGLAPSEVVARLTCENERLSKQVAEETAERARHGRELETARDVQQRLMPQSCPAIAGLDYAGRSRAALGVGGDYYDFIPLANGRLAIALGDVCGKGMPAALLMAALRAYVHSETAERPSDPRRLMTIINRRIYDSSPSNRFATFFYAEYDPATRTLEYVNAGHNAPMVIRENGVDRQVIRLDGGGLALGLVPDATYTSHRVTLDPGDVLVAFSDGISEAISEDGEEWGEERITAHVAGCERHGAAAIAERLFTAVDAFAGNTPQYDDMTIVAVRLTDRNPAKAGSHKCTQHNCAQHD